MPNEIYHRSEWGNPKAEGFGDVYFDASATNKLYKHSDNYENSDGTDKILRDIPNKASIVLTPTAYSDGSLNTVIPPYQVLPTELVTNGTFDTDSDWVKETGWTISNGEASIISSGNVRLYQTGYTLDANKKYELSVNVKSISSGSIRFRFGGTGSASNLEQITTTGVHTFISKPLVTTSIVGFFVSSGTTVSIDNVSVKEVQEADFDFSRGSSATRVNEKGLIEDVASNIPRIDYTSGQGALLLEPQSQNTATYSNDFTQGNIFNSSGDPSLNNGVVTSNQATSPNGQNDAWLFKDDNSGGNAAVTLNYFTVSVNSNDNNIVSVFVKKALSNNFFSVITAGFDVSANGSSFFNIEDGTLGTISENHTAKIEDYGNGWYRCSVSFKTTTDTIGSIRFRLATEDNTSNVTLDGTNGVYFFGLQCEASATQNYATSYIPTAGSTVTRSADVANNSGNADLFNDSEGVLYAEIASINQILEQPMFISLSNSTINNTVEIGYVIGTNIARFRIRSNSGLLFAQNISVSDITQFTKMAIKYKSGDIKAFINGSQVYSNTTSFSFSDNLIELAFDKGNDVDNFYGKVKSVAVFKEALTDEELAQITSATQQEVFYQMRDRMNIKNYDYYEFGDYTTRLKKLF